MYLTQLEGSILSTPLAYSKAIAMSLPNNQLQQEDLLYLNGILASEANNKNNDYLGRREFVMAYTSIRNKMLNWYHDSKHPIGYNYDSAIVTYGDTDKEYDILLHEDFPEQSLDPDFVSQFLELHKDKKLLLAVNAAIWKFEFENEAGEIDKSTKDGTLSLSFEIYFPQYSFVLDNKEIAHDDELAQTLYGNWENKVPYNGQPVYRKLNDFFYGGAAIVKYPASSDAKIVTVQNGHVPEIEIAQSMFSVTDTVTNDVNNMNDMDVMYNLLKTMQDKLTNYRTRG